jgi:hypothetical protein
MLKFKDWCNLLSVHDTIDIMHISILKPKITFVEDYFYHKTRGYSIVAHAIVDVRRRFINIFVGLLGNINYC